MKTKQSEPKARLATLAVLEETTIREFIDPPPTSETLRSWFERARIPHFKFNPAAKRGGGPIYYNVAAVEKFLRTRMGGAN